MAAPPPPLPVARLVDDDAVDPGAEGGLAAEARQRPEDPEEHFLGKVERLVGVAEEVQGEVVDHALVGGHQVGAGAFVARGAALDQRSLTAVDFRPADRASVLHYCPGPYLHAV